MLGLAYAIDNGRELDGNGRSRQLLAAAVTNDPLQAYRWLSVYLRSNPDDDRADAIEQRGTARGGGAVVAVGSAERDSAKRIRR